MEVLAANCSSEQKEVKNYTEEFPSIRFIE